MKQKVLIIGAGEGGSALLSLLQSSNIFKIIGIIDINPKAEGLQLAKEQNIATGDDITPFLEANLDVMFDMTGDYHLHKVLLAKKHENTLLIPGDIAKIVTKLAYEKEDLIEKLKEQTQQGDLILNSTHDGMIVVDKDGTIKLFNKSAARMTGYKTGEAIGKYILEVIPTSKLLRIVRTKQVEINQELTLENGKKIITTRIPILKEDGEVQGAFAIFKDITEVVDLAEEVTDLKEIQTLLEAIIHSSEEAISVVDEKGRGLVINPAYTKLTGLSEDDIIGKPATTDIVEGESMHMKVLRTRRAVRGIHMKIGQKKRDVIVNVAPVIVDGILKGSVGVIRDVSEIRKLTHELNRARQIIRTLEAKYSFDDIVGTSDETMAAIEQAKLGANTPATVLLRGESGTGKELFAHAIHNGSNRKYNKFVRVNCAAISENLLESELFGYEEGAFSGARRGGKRGFFEEANNGSIFLDEIGELSASTQAKLLRVLQEKEIVKVGGTKAIPINVRVIAATHVNLEKAILKGEFREDLYYRLNKIPIQIPSLRQRKEDIAVISERLIQKINQDYGRNVEGLTKSAIEYLQSYDWPGNVRELENILGRAIIFMNYNEVYIDVHHLPPLHKEDQMDLKVSSLLPELEEKSLDHLVAEFEGNIIHEYLEKFEGNKTKTAKALGISVRNLYYKLEKFDCAKNSMQ
ncbi:sigma-54-dependent Fis family transcriptional regulator [Bacillus pseudomycoides]|uniref:Sigma-54-dependent Fis family transcriptional regulator n=1 Tax=Bacillus pseudomycoides TaxID=64104 RepID=A0AA91VGQ2_9BACI|nr:MULTISPECIES: sigma-54-dependent Fis family transcriptional regulator [Bacillus]PEB53260.1 sigma-54-dependent Fis family transcriptional regulator [Bacillus sp. AFS098217]PED83870.1 sigma-54-dependent Fis family transcriptional regulator [Bacillus pseudomycoides]PEU14659.1 sigma-54-dependent Fis family transcriptional regulator [Bacillus sp. AFS019443]PEU19587.1 sigma-54-dependent Fis family transcriptional regulator [Bacillus sp. AFS014408]PFW64331.1 sigma-54-dependent Fis family transcrip